MSESHGSVGEAPRAEDRARRWEDAHRDLAVHAYALWASRVTFHDVAGAWFRLSDPELPSELRTAFEVLSRRCSTHSRSRVAVS